MLQLQPFAQTQLQYFKHLNKTIHSTNSTFLGEAKNINKNPVAEKPVQELEKVILQQDPSGDPISAVSLDCAASRLNTRIRNSGLSAHEMWFQREQSRNIQLYTPDDHLITSQHSKRLDSHKIEQNKSSQRIPPKPPIPSGDIVYLRSEKSKPQAPRRYLVVLVGDVYCHVRKFTESQKRCVYRIASSFHKIIT